MPKAKSKTGPIGPREMTQYRDRVGKLRGMAREAGHIELEQGLEKLWVDLDRLDLRFKLHHDSSAKKEGQKVKAQDLEL